MKFVEENSEWSCKCFKFKAFFGIIDKAIKRKEFYE